MNKKIFKTAVLIFCMLGAVLISDVWATKMYWTDSGTRRIQRANLDGSNIETLISTGLSSPVSMALDMVRGKMYWIDSSTDDKIQQANLDGSDVQDIVTELDYGIIDIALDLVGDKIYWTDCRADKIQRANLDGTAMEDLVTGLDYPYGIAIDSSGGKMYWTDPGTRKIQRANLDGTVVEDLLTWIQYPYGIALDVAGGKMYWTNPTFGKIQRANLDGTEVEDLIDLIIGLGGIYNIALDVGDGKMYWVDNWTDKIQRANLDGSNIQDIVTGLDNSFGIAISHPLIIDELQIQPWESLISSGSFYGPFTPECMSYTLMNNGPNTINWSADWVAEWVDITPSGGTLANGVSTEVEVCINSSARYLEPGIYNDYVTFSNASSGIVQRRYVELTVRYAQAKLLALDGAIGDYFGRSVSIDGDYAIVGADWDNDNDSNSGSAYIFKRDGAIWSEQAKLTASDGTAGDWFGISVSISGDYAIVGAHGDDDNGSMSGSAYIFKRDDTAWSQQAKLTASDGDIQDYFGRSVSIDGDYAIVGAYCKDEIVSNSGSAYIFKRDGTAWSQQAKLTASDAYENDYFGLSVSIDGEYAIVGAYLDDANGSNSGSAYIFKRDGENWMEQTRLTASDGEEDDSFGISVSIDDEYVIVGAWGDDDYGQSAGSAYIFKRDGEVWSEQAKLMPLEGNAFDYFGVSVSIDGEYAIVGAYRDSENGTYSGSAYMFKCDGASWIRQTKLMPLDGQSYDYFGMSVSIDGDYAIVGAYRDDDNGSDSGSAYVFRKMYAGDVIYPYGVDMFDFAVLGEAWFSDPNMGNWDAACDISEPADNVIDGHDLGVFVGNWLEGL